MINFQVVDIARGALVNLCFGLLFVSPALHSVEPDRDLIVEMAPQVQEVSLHEPVFVELVIENHGQSSKKVYLPKGLGSSVTIELEDGREIKSPLRRRAGIVVGGRTVVTPGAKFETEVLLNEWYSFPKPGRYAVRITISTEPVDGAGRRTIEKEVSVIVGERDPKALREICDGLASRAIVDSSESSHQSAKAVSLAVDEVCLDAMIQMLQNGPFLTQQEAITGLAMLPDSRSVSILIGSWCALHPELRARAIQEFSYFDRRLELMEALDEAGLQVSCEAGHQPNCGNGAKNGGHQLEPGMRRSGRLSEARVSNLSQGRDEDV